MTGPRIHLALAVAGACLVAACTPPPYKGPTSLYADRYEAFPGSADLPSVDEIEATGVQWTFGRPAEDVWSALLNVVVQYESLLGMDATRDNARRLLFVHGQVSQIMVGSGPPNAGMRFDKFLDTWVAVSVRSMEEHGAPWTMVSVAWIEPITGKSTPIRALSIPSAVVNRLFYELSTQLYGPSRWLVKFESGAVPDNVPVHVPPDVERNERDADQPELEQTFGDWASAAVRRTFVEVVSPEIQSILQGIASRIRAAAREKEREVRVTILASPEFSAFAFPNGDVFVTSGLLEALETTDELAAVLGHSLDHVFQHDMVDLLKNRRNRAVAGMTAGVIVMAAVVAVPVAAPAAGAAAAGSGGLASGFGSAMSAAMLQNAVQMTLGQILGSVVASVISGPAVVGFSEDTELRADYDGAQYLMASGYDPSSYLEVLAKLRALQVEAGNRPIPSELVNARPGLERRMEEMHERLTQLGAKTPVCVGQGCAPDTPLGAEINPSEIIRSSLGTLAISTLPSCTRPYDHLTIGPSGAVDSSGRGVAKPLGEYGSTIGLAVIASAAQKEPEEKVRDWIEAIETRADIKGYDRELQLALYRSAEAQREFEFIDETDWERSDRER